jgi:Protein of unknown function (DUF3105)
MATKKKPNRPRPQSSSRPAPKSPAKPSPGQAPKAAAQSPAKQAAGQPAKQAPAQTKGAAARPKTGPTRSERLAAAETARRRKATRTRAVIILAVVAVIALLVVTISASRHSNDRTIANLEASGSCKYDSKTDTDAGPGNNHVNGDVQYATDPPSGGNHNPVPAAAGTYTVDNKPPDAQIVHALEHGYVTIWYKPDVVPATLTDLQTLAAKYDRDVLLVPRASMAKPVAATAWHRRLLCTQPDTSALESFITSYRNQGPEKIPH